MTVCQGEGIEVKKYVILPIFTYMVVCMIAILLPTSDEAYNVISWKLFVGQIYAIPVLLITALISYVLYKKRTSTGNQ